MPRGQRAELNKLHHFAFADLNRPPTHYVAILRVLINPAKESQPLALQNVPLTSNPHLYFELLKPQLGPLLFPLLFILPRRRAMQSAESRRKHPVASLQ